MSVIFSVKSFAGGDLVNNGGGLAEKNILFALARVEKLSAICLTSETCKLNAKEKGILLKIIKNMPLERQNQVQIQFRSEVKSPGFFNIDGEIKVAKTGLQIGSPIFVNTDMLYHTNSNGLIESISLSDSLAILLHELGHHQGVYTHDELDLMAIKIAQATQQKIYSTPLLPWSNIIQSTLINGEGKESFPDFILYVQDEAFDFSNLLEKKVFCPVMEIPIPVIPIPDITIGKNKPNGVFIHNLHWSKQDSKGGDYEIVANLSLNCKGKPKVLILNNDYKVKISFKINSEKSEDGLNKKWVLDRESLKVKQFRNPWWKFIRLPFI
jgi:hypothetical protein